MAKVLTESVITDRAPEEERVRQWRFQWLFHAGFSVANAEKLASSSVNLHLACDAMVAARAKGLDEEFVMTLLL